MIQKVIVLHKSRNLHFFYFDRRKILHENKYIFDLIEVAFGVQVNVPGTNTGRWIKRFECFDRLEMRHYPRLPHVAKFAEQVQRVRAIVENIIRGSEVNMNG